MAADMASCASNAQKCHQWGRIFLKSMRQKVTNSTRNKAAGNITENACTHHLPHPSSAGIAANAKYTIVPIEIATGRVQFLQKLMMRCNIAVMCVSFLYR